ncbi:MAG TPA: hypothetical protein VK572_01810 [Burkholderiales bacterium]|nr:hypothetical protein [Burkholderiales bacterium]
MLKKLRNWVALIGLLGFEEVWSQMSEFQLQEQFKEKMRRAVELDTQAVEQLYSTKQVRVILGAREYVIPANHFGPKEKDGLDTFDAGKVGYFGFFLFLPDYSGYTKKNWRDKFDPRLVKVLQIKMVDKNETVFNSELGYQRVNPAGYGEPKAQFQNARRGLEDKPSLRAHGLEGYRPKYGTSDVTWTGTRSNGEFFFFTSHLAPGEAPKPGTYPFCDVRYYSEKETSLLLIAIRTTTSPSGARSTTRSGRNCTAGRSNKSPQSGTRSWRTPLYIWVHMVHMVVHMGTDHGFTAFAAGV